MVLNVRASRRTSGGPCPVGERVSSAPPPSFCAAMSRSDSGRLTHRASMTAKMAAASRPTAATPISQVQSMRRRSSSSPVGRASTSAPAGWPLTVPSTLKVTRSSPPVLVTVIMPLWRRTPVMAPGGTGTFSRFAPPKRLISWAPALKTQTSSLAARVCTKGFSSTGPGLWSMRLVSAANASACADKTVSIRKESCSRPAMSSPSGATAVTSRTLTSSSMVSTIRRAITGHRGGSPCRRRPRSAPACRACGGARPHGRPAPWSARTGGHPRLSPGSPAG